MERAVLKDGEVAVFFEIFRAWECLLRLGSPIHCRKGDDRGEGVDVEQFYRYEVLG